MLKNVRKTPSRTLQTYLCYVKQTHVTNDNEKYIKTHKFVFCIDVSKDFVYLHAYTHTRMCVDIFSRREIYVNSRKIKILLDKKKILTKLLLKLLTLTHFQTPPL